MDRRPGKAFQSNLTDGLMFTLASALFLVVSLWWPLAYEVPIISSNLTAVVDGFNLGDMTVFVGSMAAQIISAVFALFAGIQALTFSNRYKQDLLNSKGWLVGVFTVIPPLTSFVVIISILACAMRIVLTLYGFGKL